MSRKNEGDKVIVYERAGLVFAFNFHPTKSYSEYKIGVQVAGKYPFRNDSCCFVQSSICSIAMSCCSLFVNYFAENSKASRCQTILVNSSLTYYLL